MHKILIVARHEYGFNVRRKGFLIATFVMPLALIAMLAAVVFSILVTSQLTDIGFVDQADLLPAKLDASEYAAISNAVVFQEFSTLEAGIASVEAGSIEVLFVVPSTYVQTGIVEAYVSDTLPALASSMMTSILRQAVVTQLADEQNPRVLLPIAQMSTAVLDAAPDAQQSPILAVMVPLLFGMMLLGSTFSGGSYLMTAIAEEKENRILEILASSLSPYQMMIGKILGLGALTLTQLFVWGLGFVGLLWLGSQTVNVAIGSFLLSGFGAIVLVFIPTYFIIAASLASIGASVNSVQQGQQLTGLVTLLCMLPIWLIFMLARSPNGLLALMFSIFPLTSPVTLIVRFMAGSVPLWQLILNVIWLWVAAAGMMYVAGFVVQRGLTRYGQRSSWRWRFRKKPTT